MDIREMNALKALSQMAELGVGHVGVQDVRSNETQRWNGVRVPFQVVDRELPEVGLLQAVASAMRPERLD